MRVEVYLYGDNVIHIEDVIERVITKDGHHHIRTENDVFTFDESAVLYFVERDVLPEKKMTVKEFLANKGWEQDAAFPPIRKTHNE